MQKLYIYIPGLGGERILQRQREVIQRWENDQRDCLFVESRWNNKQETYPAKLQRLLEQIRKAADGYDLVCLVGTSAGGTLGLNLFYELRQNPDSSASFPGSTGESNASVVGSPIGVGNDNTSEKTRATTYKFVSVGGKLTGVDAIGKRYSQPHPALIPSVTRSEEIITRLSDKDKNQILTVGPLFDEVVYTRFMKIPGVRHKTLPTILHIPSIWLVIRYFPNIIFRFAEKQSKAESL